MMTGEQAKKNRLTQQHKELSINKVWTQFQKEEASSGHREGTFKIDKPFEEALAAILKTKPPIKRAATDKD